MVTNNAINLSQTGLAYYNGTGTFSAPSLTAHGVVIGSTTTNDILTTAVGATGTVLIGNTGADPSFSASPSLTSLTLTNPLTVANGGTGANSLTLHGVLVGEGTSPITSVVGTTGTVLIGNTGADPSFSASPSLTSLTLTNPLTVANGGTGAGTLTAHGVLIGEGTSPITPIVLSAGQVLIGTTAGDPSATTLTAGSGVSITNASGSITIALSGSGGVVWNDVTTTPTTLAANNGYVADVPGATLAVFVLPSTPVFGDTYHITGRSNGSANTGGWEVSKGGTSQLIVVGTSTATTAIQSTAQTDSIIMVCTHANGTTSEFTVIDAVTSGLTIT